MTDYERNLPTMPGDATPPIPARMLVPLDVCPHQFPWGRVVLISGAISLFVAVAVVSLAR